MNCLAKDSFKNSMNLCVNVPVLLQPVMPATGGQTAPNRATAGTETAAVTL